MMDITHPTARLPDGQRIYAVGDIHGMADALADIFRRIDADSARGAPAEVTEVYLGDYVDRGPASADVLAMLDARRKTHRAICLLGNHELFLLDALTDLERFRTWMKYGGRATLESFGVTPPERGAEATAAQALFREKITGDVRDFLERLALTHKAGDFLFVHAGIRPGVPLIHQTMADLTFIRDEFLNSEVDFGCVVVHGHTPAPAVEVRPFRIGLDTGACYGGPLSCLAIEGGRLRLV